MTKRAILLLTGALLLTASPALALIEATPSAGPSAAQQAQIARKYGMFCHFGINTYADKEWSDGSLPPETYAPPADLAEKADAWVKTAHDAGMRYFICITKHHDGFCMWDTKYTDYCVFNPSVKNHVDVVRAVSIACKKYGIGFAVYYSLWDRHWDRTHGDLYKKDRAAADKAYVDYMVNELQELMTQYGPVTEIWVDGGWAKAGPRWDFDRVYDVVKRNQPQCQVTINWNIGRPDKPGESVPPEKQKDGYPIICYPSDFRIADPHIPIYPDPKHFTHDGKTFYMPFETTVAVGPNWFFHSNDTQAKSPASLEDLFDTATAQDNLLVLNVPPNRQGVLAPPQVASIMEMAKDLGIDGGKPFPARENLTLGATAEASAVWTGTTDKTNYSASQAVDGNPGTRWACAAGVTSATLDLDFGKTAQFNHVVLSEYGNRIKSFDLEVPDGAGWKPIYSGSKIGSRQDIEVNATSASRLRLNVKEAIDPPSIFEVKVLDIAK